MALFCLKANAYAIWEGPFNSTWEDTGMFRFLEQAYLKSYKIRNNLHSSETVTCLSILGTKNSFTELVLNLICLYK